MPARATAAKRGRLLVAYDNAFNYIATFDECLKNISRHSRWDVRYLHVTNGAIIDVDLGDFDAIFHSYPAQLDIDGYVSAEYLSRLKSFRGVKMLALQDEYDRTDKLRNAIRELGFHIVLTCLPERAIECVYPRAMFPHTKFEQVLTGYVSDRLAERGKTARPLRDRLIHIGYRGRKEVRRGRLGFLKFEIGRRMREICVARGVPHDIEWVEEKRIYGDAWYDFVASCRANLGCESGSNVFDFDGTIEEAYERLCAERGAPVPYEEFRRYTDPIEAQYDCGQISPRIFEAAALRTPLILFPGKYSGLIEPEEHYIPLAEDFSNVDAVLARLEDLEALEAMAERAHRRLVGSGEFSYRRFVEKIDGLLLEKAADLGIQLRPPLQGRENEIGADRAALASLIEHPTRAPRHFVFYDYKALTRENTLYKEEIARLNEVYPAEIARLNQIISKMRKMRKIFLPLILGRRLAVCSVKRAARWRLGSKEGNEEAAASLKTERAAK